MREIEIKIRATNLDAIKTKLEQLGCKLSDPITQHDTIYSLAANTQEEWKESKEGHVVMRIRRQGGSIEFNLKKQKTNELDNLEYETEITNPDDMHKILVELGYVPQVEVKKVRRKCKLEHYEICLDEVEKLGSFVEIEELASDDANPEEIQKKLIEVLESLGLSREHVETRGYDTQIYQSAIRES